MCVHRFWETYVVVGSGGRTEHPVYPAALGCVSHDINKMCLVSVGICDFVVVDDKQDAHTNAYRG